MIVKSLEINNLRNIESARIDAHPRLNFLYGDNGAGKTSVLESLVILAKGRSFRAGHVSSLIGPVTDALTVVIRTETPDGGEGVLGFERGENHWRARKNGEDLEQLSSLATELPLVLIEPNSHQLISGGPEQRRRYIDWGVFHVEHDHLLHWRRYSKALKQRNAALRLKQEEVAASLEPVLSELGEKLHSSRQEHFSGLKPLIKQNLEDLSPELSGYTVEYKRGWGEEPLSELFSSTRARDLERGQTRLGPHRADLEIKLNKQPAKDWLSRGEQKAFSVALLLTQAQAIADSGQAPLLLLDDIASEFDDRHLANVLGFGDSLNAQVWVTGTDMEPYQRLLDSPAGLFHVEHGKIAQKTNT